MLLKIVVVIFFGIKMLRTVLLLVLLFQLIKVLKSFNLLHFFNPQKIAIPNEGVAVEASKWPIGNGF
jgi:hypothetical protein